MTIRDTLLAAVTAAAPAGTRVIPYQDNVDVLDAVTIMFKQLSMAPLAGAPAAAFRVNYVLTVVSAAADPSVSEIELDEYVPTLLGGLAPLDWFAWETAEKVLGPGGIGLAYDVSCWTIAQATPTAPVLDEPPTTHRKKERADHA